MRTKHSSTILVVTVVALMMATGAAAQTRAAERSSAGEVAVHDALVAVPPPMQLAAAFRALRFPAPEVPQPSFRLASVSVRSFQQSATPQRSWIAKHPVKFGALVGAGIGAVIGIAAYKNVECPTGRVCPMAGGALLFYPALGAGIGALFGSAARK